MLLDNLITHLQELREITGGKVQVKAHLETESCNIEDFNLTVLRTEEGISIRNF